MAAPRVSIIIPTFNRAAMLPQALDSVLEQDYEPVELIVLDDGSTDGTPEVLAEYSRRYGRDRLLCERHANVGQSASYNRGFELSTGPIVGELSSDDWLLPGAIRLQVQALEADPFADVVSGANYVVDEHGDILDTLLPSVDTFKSLVRNQEISILAGALLRRSLFERVGGWNPAYPRCPDYEFYLRAGPSLRHIVVDEVVGVTRSHAQQISRTAADLEMARERLRLLDSLFEDPVLAAEIVEVREEAYANLFALNHLITLGSRANAPDQRWLVLDTVGLRRSRLAQRREQLQLPRRRFEIELLHRQLQAHIDIIADIEETNRVQARALEHLEAALADRDALLARGPGPSLPAYRPATPSWWKAARALTPRPLRHQLGAIAHRRVLPRLNGKARR